MKGQFLAAILLLTFVPPATASDETQLKPFERGSWQQLLRSHRRHPTLVQFWGVTCGPCKVELPQLGEFMKGHPAIDVVTVSADLVPDLPDATRSMPQKSGLS
jgi:thiol-disulfide isomerase/thioredoxin